MAHISIETLLNSVVRSHGKRLSHAELARALNVSEQVITNWASRGISVDGALTAQLVFHKDANYILGRVSHPMLLPRDEVSKQQEPDAHQVREEGVTYIAPAVDEKCAEMLKLFNSLDDAGKREWLADLRGFVRGRRPHTYGHPAAVAERK